MAGRHRLERDHPMDMGLLVLAAVDGFSYAALVFMVASGLSLIFGVMRILNIAHGGFYAIGAYSAVSCTLWVAARGFSPWLQFPALLLSAIIVGSLVGPLLERFLLRKIYDKEEVLQLLVTFAIFMILEDAQRLIWGAQPYATSDPIRILGSIEILGVPYMTYQIILLPCVAVAVLLGLRWLMSKTLLGRTITATTEDREAAMAMGINTERVFIVTFTLGTILAAAGGALAAPTTAVQLGMGADMIILSFAVVATAGLGQIGGAAVAAIMIGMGRALAVYYAPEVDVLVPYLIMVVVLLFRPQGLFGVVHARKI